MILRELALHNYRMFEDLKVQFDPKLTLIVGLNGSGKTCILEAAAVAIGTLMHSLDKVEHCNIKKFDPHCKYFTLGSVIDVQPQFPVEITAAGTVNGRDIQWTRSLNSENGVTTIGDAKEMKAISNEFRSRLMNGDAALILPVIGYYGTGRLRNQSPNLRSGAGQKNTRVNGYLSCLDGAANIQQMTAWFQKMALSDSQRPTPSPEYAAVRGAMQECFSLMTGITHVEVQLNPDTMEIEILYESPETGPVRIPINRLSDGYRCTISLIADIAFRMAILNPQLSGEVLRRTPGVVLIDEIDLHLHPAWQQRVIRDLTTIFPQVQFIITTHAPAVINSVRSKNLIILKDQVALRLSNQVYGKDVKSVLNEIMGVRERPEEVAELFDSFYFFLENSEFDKAEGVLDKLDILRDYHDPEVAACRVRLKMERIRGGHR